MVEMEDSIKNEGEIFKICPVLVANYASNMNTEQLTIAKGLMEIFNNKTLKTQEIF